LGKLAPHNPSISSIQIRYRIKIAVVGLGYGGLPLSLQFARSEATVSDLDIDPAKVEAHNAGRGYSKQIAPDIAQTAYV
jgi:UDP-N-acetyl-D-mannosaminuronate dehydrogenase